MVSVCARPQSSVAAAGDGAIGSPLAAVNGPSSVGVSGDPQALQELLEEL